MVSILVILPLLATIANAQLPVPGSLPGVGSIQAQYNWILQQQAHLNQQVQYTQVLLQQQVAANRGKRSVNPLIVPGTTPVLALEADPVAKAQWYNALQQWRQQQVAAGRKKRSINPLILPGTTPVLALEADPVAKAQWYNALQQWRQQQVAYNG